LKLSLPDPRTALIALNATSGLPPRTTFQISLQEDWVNRLCRGSFSETRSNVGINERTSINFNSLIASDFAQREINKARDNGVRIVTFLDDDYPSRLKEIADPPVVLYVKGRIPAPEDVLIAIVGSREASSYGLGIAEQFAMRFAEAGAAVISGLARGIDAMAHRGTLKAGGRTLAVLGCGIDMIYPFQNRDLYKEIAERGCLISEFPFGAEPYLYHFPRRNRIVSGLSHGVVVVEARQRSGALITAQFALEQGRDVFAVPGRIDVPYSRGTHELIRNGAKIILSVEDVFEEIPGLKSQPELFSKVNKKKPSDLTADELKVLSIITQDAVSFDTLAAKAGLPVPALMGVCLSLELRRLVRELPGKMYELL